MVRSSDHWSNHQRGRGKINQIPVLTIREIYICPDVFLTSCSEVCLWWDDLSISFMEKEKTRRLLGGSTSLPPSFHFILLFWRFASRVDRQREGFQKAAADLIYITADLIWSGATAPWGTSFALIDWRAKQRTGGQTGKRFTATQTDTVWTTTGWRRAL